MDPLALVALLLAGAFVAFVSWAQIAHRPGPYRPGDAVTGRLFATITRTPSKATIRLLRIRQGRADEEIAGHASNRTIKYEDAVELDLSRQAVDGVSFSFVMQVPAKAERGRAGTAANQAAKTPFQASQALNQAMSTKRFTERDAGFYKAK